MGVHVRLAIKCYMILLITAFPQPSRLEIISLTDCTCPGHELKLICTVVGAGFTEWRVNNYSIIFRHSNFIAGEEVEHFNDREIVGRWRKKNGQNITTELTILVSLTLAGTEVQCIYDNGLMRMIAGRYNISFTTEPYKPPDDVQLTDISLNQLTFSWSLVPINCVAVQYFISSTGCGVCPSATVNTSVTCNVSTHHRDRDHGLKNSASDHCSLSVQTVLCGNIIGNKSNSASVMLRGPDMLSFKQVIPYYSSSSQFLTRIEVELFTLSMDSFNVTDKVSLVSYTIIYSDFLSVSICGSIDIPASSCMKPVCGHVFDRLNTSCLLNSQLISLTAFATNFFGNGSPATPMAIGTTNRLFDVEFDSNGRSVLCQFNQLYFGDNKSCSIVYGPKESDDCYSDLKNVTRVTSNFTSLDSAIIPLSLITQQPTYCFIAKGVIRMMTIAIVGTFTINRRPASTVTEYQVTLIAISSLCFVVGILIVVLFFGVVIHRRRRKKWNIAATVAQSRGVKEGDREGHDQDTSKNPGMESAIYAEIPNTFVVKIDDDTVKYAMLDHGDSNPRAAGVKHSEQYEDQYSHKLRRNKDFVNLDVDGLLILFGSEVTLKWYQFGEAVGVSKVVLDSISQLPSENRLGELLNYWLQNHYKMPTWTELAEALKEIKLFHLAEKISRLKAGAYSVK